MTDIRDRIDPETRVGLDALLAAVPGGFGAIADLGERRMAIERHRRALAAQAPPADNVTVADHVVPGPAGAPRVGVRTVRPAAADGVLPAIYYIHGGGMVLGTVAGDDAIYAMLSTTLGVAVVAVEYRLAPEHPYPAAVEDSYAGLVWLAGHAAELGIDAGRIAILGRSAGGGLAIAIALAARDRGGPPIRFLMPVYPMLDDRNATPSSHEILDLGIWDRAANLEAWAWYLGGQSADGYAAPARAADLIGLPPTFIDVGELDLFRDENLEFAARLLQAGVPTELHVYPGAFHASEVFAPGATLSKTIWGNRLAALRAALHS